MATRPDFTCHLRRMRANARRQTANDADYGNRSGITSKGDMARSMSGRDDAGKRIRGARHASKLVDHIAASQSNPKMDCDTAKAKGATAGRHPRGARITDRAERFVVAVEADGKPGILVDWEPPLSAPPPANGVFESGAAVAGRCVALRRTGRGARAHARDRG
jgi:hypothetical protein